MKQTKLASVNCEVNIYIRKCRVAKLLPFLKLNLLYLIIYIIFSIIGKSLKNGKLQANID